MPKASPKKQESTYARKLSIRKKGGVTKNLEVVDQNAPSQGVNQNALSFPPYTPVDMSYFAKMRPNPAIPPLKELAEDYQLREDGRVVVFGEEWEVSHAISKAGLLTMKVDGDAD